jgi:hypothetical protein
MLKFKFDRHEDYNFRSVGRKNNIPDGWKVSLNSTFPNISDTDSVVRKEQRDSLKQDLYRQIRELFVRDLHIINPFEIGDFWYNIYHQGQGQEPHQHLSDCSHPNPFWCGIYYYRGASPTKFSSPVMIHKMHRWVGVHDTLLKDCFSEYYAPRVEDGDVILFPPYLEHCIYSTQVQMRMTFAFNLYLI